jgi:hypothetical protein
MFIFVIIPKDIIENDVFYKKNPIMYFIGFKKVSPPPLLSLCHTPSLFPNEIMKYQVLNKIVCSMMEIYFLFLKIVLPSFRSEVFSDTGAGYLRRIELSYRLVGPSAFPGSSRFKWCVFCVTRCVFCVARCVFCVTRCVFCVTVPSVFL